MKKIVVRKYWLFQIIFNMIPDRNNERLKEGITYVLQIQHVNIISQHEFIPIKIGND